MSKGKKLKLFQSSKTKKVGFIDVSRENQDILLKKLKDSMKPEALKGRELAITECSYCFCDCDCACDCDCDCACECDCWCSEIV